MGDTNEHQASTEQLAKVIRFPSERVAPAPLPSLRRTFPTPGAGRSQAAPLFGAALTRRFDRDAA